MSIRVLAAAVVIFLGSTSLVFSCEIDRLDGKGISKVELQLIAWHDDNRYEMQITPKGKIEAIGYKIVEGKRGRRLVLSYRFKKVQYYSKLAGKSLKKFYRFTSLEIPLPATGAKAFISSTARKGHDHLILTKDVVKDKKYKELALDPAPEFEEPMDCKEDMVPRKPAAAEDASE